MAKEIELRKKKGKCGFRETDKNKVGHLFYMLLENEVRYRLRNVFHDGFQIQLVTLTNRVSEEWWSASG